MANRAKALTPLGLQEPPLNKPSLWSAIIGLMLHDDKESFGPTDPQVH